MARITLSTLITAAVNAAVSSRVAQVLHGTGNPNGSVSAPSGALFCNTEPDGWNGVRLWSKTTASGTSGWVPQSGDSGRRALVSALEPAWTLPASLGAVEISRVGELVHVFGRVQCASAGGLRSLTSNVLTIPTGFRPVGYAPQGVATFDSHTGVATTSSSTSTLSLGRFGSATGTWAVGDTVAFSATWRTAQPWPTTLPGTPA